MPLLFLLLVVFTAIVGFFSQELLHGFKRIFSIPGTKLCFPLMFASLIAESYALWGYRGLSSLRATLSILEHRVSALLPFQTAALMLTRVFILTILAMIPLWIIAFLTRKNHLSGAMYWAYCCSAVICAVSVILLITE
jgi:hypothetical protein